MRRRAGRDDADRGPGPLTVAATSPRALIAFATVSFTYFAFAGFYVTYSPLWFQRIGYSTLTIGTLVSLQSATRLVAPYAWAWMADHTGQRLRLLHIAAFMSFAFATGYFAQPWLDSFGWIGVVTVALFLSTAGVIPLSEAALAHLVTDNHTVDTKRYGRVRVWGSIGYIVAVASGGFALQAVGVPTFPVFIAVLLLSLYVSSMRLPVVAEPPHAGERAMGVMSVLRKPGVAWFFAGCFLTVLAHTALYAFYSLYLASLGYSDGAIGLLWATGVAIEVLWFWFQGRWLHRLTVHAWLIVAALVSAFRFALIASFGATPWILVGAQCLHCLTFAAQHTACIAVVSRHFPGRLRGRGQALYTILGYGASGVVGGVLGGVLSERHGFTTVFWAASGAGLLSALCCWRAWLVDRPHLPPAEAAA